MTPHAVSFACTTASSAGLSPLLKDILQAATWLVAVVGGIVAVFKAVAELAKSTAERTETRLANERELRWRQAEVAKTVIDELLADASARTALKMLDWSGLTYTRQDGVLTTEITTAVFAAALRTTDANFTNLDEPFIRDCVDALLDGFERIEHYIRVGLILWDDVNAPFAYYAKKLIAHGEVLNAFVEAYEFNLAKDFIARFVPKTGGDTAHVMPVSGSVRGAPSERHETT